MTCARLVPPSDGTPSVLFSAPPQWVFPACRIILSYGFIYLQPRPFVIQNRILRKTFYSHIPILEVILPARIGLNRTFCISP